jgi:hypothetical protein
MADVPTNQRLWNSLVVQAKAKFKSWPSLPASKWVHKEYVQRGGRFVDSKRVTEAKKRQKESAKRRQSSPQKKEKGDKK